MYRRLLAILAGSSLLPDRLRPTVLRRLGIAVGDGCLIFSGLRLGDGTITLGERVFVNKDCYLDPGTSHIELGDHVVLAVGVVLTAASHAIGGPERRATGTFSAPIRVGRGSWLGARAVVLPGVTIAPGCVVGAGAVVTKDTEPNAVYAGVPARWLRDL
jgi:maltose O-acetyltransferase